MVDKWDVGTGRFIPVGEARRRKKTTVVERASTPKKKKYLHDYEIIPAILFLYPITKEKENLPWQITEQKIAENIKYIDHILPGSWVKKGNGCSLANKGEHLPTIKDLQIGLIGAKLS